MLCLLALPVRAEGESGRLVKQADGSYRYLLGDVWQKEFTGFFQNEKGEALYIKNGIWQNKKTGYVKRESDEKWVYLQQGVLLSSFNGVKKTAPGVQAYLTAGVWDREVSGLQPGAAEGKILYVRRGVWQEAFTGFVKDAQGQSCYVLKGVWQKNKTGYVKRESDEKWVYLQQGVLLSSFNGVKKTAPGVQAYLTAGVWDREVSGLKPGTAEGKLLYVKKGVWQSGFSGIYKDDKAVRHYIRDGVKDDRFTGWISQSHYVYQVSAGQVSLPKKQVMQVPEKRKVILISIDGMRPDGFQKCGHAYAKQILKQSRYSLTGQTVYPSYTLPAHYSLFHGADPARHGITENYYRKPKESVMGLVEHLRGNGRHCAMYYSWESLKYIANAKDLKASGFIDGTAGPSVNADERLTQMALDYIGESKPDFVFLYLLDTDEWGGHPYGWMSKEYLARLSKALDCVKRVQEAAGKEYTILLTSDHGGHGKSHGTDKAEDMMIPLFALGPDFAGGSKFGSFSILDIAPTVSALMGLAPDKGWSGKSLLP